MSRITTLQTAVRDAIREDSAFTDIPVHAVHERRLQDVVNTTLAKVGQGVLVGTPRTQILPEGEGRTTLAVDVIERPSLAQGKRWAGSLAEDVLRILMHRAFAGWGKLDPIDMAEMPPPQAIVDLAIWRVQFMASCMWRIST